MPKKKTMNLFQALPVDLQVHIHSVAAKRMFDDVICILPRESSYKKELWKSKRNHANVVCEINSLSSFLRMYSWIQNVGEKYLACITENMDNLDTVTHFDYFMWFLNSSDTNHLYDDVYEDLANSVQLTSYITYVHSKTLDRFYMVQKKTFC